MHPNSRTKNIFPSICSEALQHSQFELKTKVRSLSFGRRLYFGQLGEESYWLKVQHKQGVKPSEDGFVNEFQFYQSLQHIANSQILLPAQLIHDPIIIAGEQYEKGLLLPHCPAHFATSAESLTLEDIQSYLLDSLSAVMDVYRCGYLHGDLKAEHFVRYAGQVRLIDFEQVWSIMEPQSQSLDATPRYMAPELFQGESKTLQSEIYALGIIWLEWLSQIRLSARSYEDWAYLHCQHLKIQLPEKYQQFQPVLMGMLARHKTHRFCSFQQVQAVLFTVID